jgi:uncharacterized protein YigE (DUF2233 family)
MKRKVIFSLSLTILLAIFALSGCNVSTANMSSLKTATDREGKSETSKFKAGDTFYGIAAISNNPGTVKVKFYWTDPKGSPIKSTEITVDANGSGNVNMNIPINEAMPAGEYKVTAEMINEDGEKKDSKTANFSIVEE